MDTELLHALRFSTVDASLYPHLSKWIHLVKSKHSEEERRRWPTTPGAKPAPGTALKSASGLETTPRGGGGGGGGGGGRSELTRSRLRGMMGETGDANPASPKPAGKRMGRGGGGGRGEEEG